MRGKKKISCRNKIWSIHHSQTNYKQSKSGRNSKKKKEKDASIQSWILFKRFWNKSVLNPDNQKNEVKTCGPLAERYSTRWKKMKQVSKNVVKRK